MPRVKVKRLVSHKALRIIDLALLKVDPSYQRDVKAKHKAIVANFDEDAFGVPLIGERDDGSLWIVDGQQRITAVRKLGHTKARVEVFRSEGPTHEANVFKLVNINRTKLSALEQFRALLTSGDEAAWAVKETVEKAKYKIVLREGRNQRAPKELICHNTLLNIYRTQGPEAITFALKVIDAAWPDNWLATISKTIQGLAVFYAQQDSAVDLDRLIPRLRTVTIEKVLSAASQLNLGSGGLSASYGIAEVVTRLYNKRNVGKPKT